MSFTLYNYVLSGNCYKVRLLAALLKVPYETVAVDFYPGFEHKSPQMLALNPAGTLPVLKAGEMVLTETQAMLVWLALEFDASGKWYPQGDARQSAMVQEWLGFAGRLTQSAGLARLHDMLNWPVDGDAAKAAATADLRVQSDSGLAAHVECTDALRPVELVATDREEVNVALVNINGDLADALGGIRVEEHFVLPADCANLLNGLNRADLVVNVDDTAQKSIRAHGLFQLLQVDEASLELYGEISHLEAHVLETAAGI